MSYLETANMSLYSSVKVQCFVLQRILILHLVMQTVVGLTLKTYGDIVNILRMHDFCCILKLHASNMIKLHSDHSSGFFSYRQQVERSSHKHIRGSAG